MEGVLAGEVARLAWYHSIPAAMLFRRSLSKLSTSASRTRTLHPSSGSYSAVVTETFTWTVSLTRRS